jgi:hypothetical protein
MRGLIGLALFAVALPVALGGCATRVDPMHWGFTEYRDEGAKLTLGVPGTDDLRLMALCQPHSGEIRLTVFGRQGDPPIVELHSGKRLWKRYGGAGVQYDEESLGGVELQFRLHADDPVLARVADTGELRMKLGDRWLVLPNGFAQEHDFIAACRTPLP